MSAGWAISGHWLSEKNGIIMCVCACVRVMFYLEGFPVETQNKHATHHNRNKYTELNTVIALR